MQKKLDGWHSPSLNKHMEIVQYGHYGFGLLLLPTAAADYLEYERFQLIDAIAPYIESGKCKVFSVNSINSESWMNRQMHPPHKAIRHNQFNQYIYQEVIPYIKTHTSPDTPIVISGASLGALHSANLFFKRPDLLQGVIAMSGDYDLQTYTDGYYDEQVYFNSPMAYIANLHDEHNLNQLRSSRHIHILTGSGSYETPDASRRFSNLLNIKGIPHELDIWGYDMPHDWPTWRAMLPHYLATRF
ncbi:MAG: esterase [Saprospiraceae bacterium]|jgi:esterase/lipase superfamily enzyme|nr:esterase [Saprospiraceae bacterium]MBK6481283.1 esterase [Saprospiraceae bacterium]MBK6817982.1 esterase [Saprospiraceae bacterium]MBK7436679.1 esterase [Saprospiraceae bacterium]MBK8279352.1 esterase [Saprospiraceae bacterium]